MAPILKRLHPERTYMFADVGSGSAAAAITQFAFGTATTVTELGLVYYSLADLSAGHSLSSVPVLALREKIHEPVGTWLASTEGMLLEGETSPAGTYARALDELKKSLGVTLTYVARCLDMQRSAVYRWYDGRQPHLTNRSRLKTLQEFAAAWRAANLPSLRNYWDTPVSDQGQSLGALLSAHALDINALREAIARLTSQTAPARKQPKLGFPGRKRDRNRDRERLLEFVAPTSHESDDDGDPT